MAEEVKYHIYSMIKTIILALIIIILVRSFLMTPTVVLGESMSPTFEDKDQVIINKISQIHRFDIVVFDAPNEDYQYVKRIIGVPGDSVEVIDDLLYINEIAMEEPYPEENKEKKRIFDSLTPNFTLEEITGEAKVPDHSFFVLGDNRENSKDSRSFGFISEESIIGEVVFKHYPLNDIGIPR